jgi:hypothetical protein
MAFIPGAGEAGEGAQAAVDLGRAAEVGEVAADAGVVAVDAAKGFGNVAGGALRAEEALTQAEKYLGPGYEEIAPGVYRSADNARQFRMTTSDLTDVKQGVHVHFESIGPDGRTITENSHVQIHQ